MRRVAGKNCLLLAVVLLFSCPVWGSSSALERGSVAVQSVAREGSATLVFVQGEVKIVPAGNGAPRTAQEQEAVQEGETLETGADSAAMLLLQDGSTVKLGATSRFLVEKVGIGKKFKLFLGRVWLTVQQMVGGGSMEVETPTAVAAVKGTTFEVIHEQDETRCSCWEGKVQVTMHEQGYLLPPGWSIQYHMRNRQLMRASFDRSAGNPWQRWNRQIDERIREHGGEGFHPPPPPGGGGSDGRPPLGPGARPPVPFQEMLKEIHRIPHYSRWPELPSRPHGAAPPWLQPQGPGHGEGRPPAMEPPGHEGRPPVLKPVVRPPERPPLPPPPLLPRRR